MLEVESKPAAADPSDVAAGSRRDIRRYLKLIPLVDARERISAQFRPVGSELVPADMSLGRVSASVVRSKRDVPGASTSAMDGYAIRSAETRRASQSKPSRFRVGASTGGNPSGSKMIVRRGEALPVSTGDLLPAGADAVVRAEEARLEAGRLLVMRAVPEEKNVSSKADDVRAGQVLLRRGAVVNAAGMALLISAGPAMVRVHKVPRVGILSVGSDLKNFADASSDKKTNNYANLILGYLSELGAEATMMGIVVDDVAEIRDRLERAARDFDMTITIGGVSVGPNDLVPDAVLLAIGSRVLFHGLRIVPLRPVGVASLKGRPVVMMPGHAVSAALSFFMIALPVLNIISGLSLHSRKSVIKAVASEKFSNDRPIDALTLATLEKREGGYAARPLGWGSNLLFNLSRASGFVHLRPEETIPAKHELNVELLGSSELSRLGG